MGLKVLFVSPEVFPLAKTGGLGDVAGFLPRALIDAGLDVRILMPAYPGTKDHLARRRVEARFGDLLGGGDTDLVGGRAKDSGLPFWLVDCPPLFDRQGLYQDDDARDWPDNALRYAVLCHVGARLAGAASPVPWRPDVVHCNDWQTGLIPALLALGGGPRPATVFTIHNLAYQGVFPAAVFPTLGLPAESFTLHGVEFHGQVSFMKAGLTYSDKLTTVSPTYAAEIQTTTYGCGLDGLLRARAGDLVGILNGVDTANWDPATDPNLPHRFDPHDMAGKARNKTALQEELGLEPAADAPLIGLVSRLTEQKGLDLLMTVAPDILARGAQLALLGVGEPALERALGRLAEEHPGRMAVQIRFDEGLAHRIEAGADVLLMPSRFEPCGLTDLYGFRYGTMSIVHRVGGLADAVIDATEDALSAGTATGFTYEESTREDLLAAIDRAIGLYRRPEQWARLRRHVMDLDFGWPVAAAKYIDLYREVVARRGDAAG